MTNKIRHFQVSGKVQGVNFRAATQREAHELKLRGWVRNCSDGSVELLVDGGEAELAKLAEWLHRGPPAARVDDVVERLVDPLDAQTLDWPFAIRR